MTEEDRAYEADSLKENSKEWAPSFTVDGVTYAASIFWESLQNVDAPFLDAKEAAENVLVGADLFCVKHGKSPQLGLAVSSQGFKKGMNVAAVTAVTAMSDATSLLAVFKVDAGYWYLCVRNDVILSDGDVLFVNEQDAKEQFVSMLSVPDWSKKIAPEEWGIEDTEQKDVAEVFASGLDVKLEKINALRGTELVIVILLSLLIGGVIINFVSKTLFTTPTQQTKVVTRRAQKKVVQEVKKIIPAPWESMIDPAWVLDTCRQNILSLVAISTPGWVNTGVRCSASNAVTSWRREFGRLSWIELSLEQSGLSFTNKSIDARGTSVTVSVPFKDVRTITSIPKVNALTLRNMINDLFQTLNLSISIADGKVQVGEKIYNYLSFKVVSKYDPEVWKSLLTKFSGLKVNNIMYNNGTWNYEGTIYVQ
ncbi:MAG: type 4b pilus protein PilO2 [Alphaproteobacteria bacterium]|nr:type 4b pilus protein PilO2 [Alphaproteobacteria bacterium]MBP3687455.1 type 4b pilus protein PilO2 [Alphaproteobacteria bacterium]